MLKQSLSALAVVTLLAACASTKPADPNANANAAGANQGATAGQMTSGNVDPLKDPNNILSKRSVYFDFDSYVVRDEYGPLMSSYAKLLSGSPQRRLTIEGHTDERGGREYNLALGQKRSEAVKQRLSNLACHRVVFLRNSHHALCSPVCPGAPFAVRIIFVGQSVAWTGLIRTDGGGFAPGRQAPAKAVCCNAQRQLFIRARPGFAK